jgi:hypothetical protein
LSFARRGRFGWILQVTSLDKLRLARTGPIRQLILKSLPPLGGPLFFRRFVGGLLLLGEVRVTKFRLRYIDVHRELGGVFIVVFLQVIGHYLVKVLAKFPEKERAAVYFFARKAEIYAGRAHIEAAVVAMGIAQALMQELIESELSSRKG